ncbi:hypothetical protein [Luteolibacter sp. LG18]|uniref:hypothetical protein n=1 Tax=Luteolibacter sp. LG18 TaxID=2819286 RepID=UPI002B2CECFB|nr:hypothetical protein llg_31100 [Luteolibacter sp. LG18]
MANRSEPQFLMTPDTDAIPSQPIDRETQTNRASLSVWRKIGGGSLSISLLVHAVLLAIGVVWIFQIIPDKKRDDVNFMPKGGGGGSPAANQVSQQKKRATMTSPNAPRLAAKGSTSSFTLPDPEPASAMSSVGSLGAGGLSGGLGGSGSGGGRGDGKGPGFGSGMGPGLGGGTGTMSPFGMIAPGAAGLVGTFYDLKQDPKRNPTALGKMTEWGELIPATRDIIHGFVSRGWNERSFESSYYRSPQKLYQTKIYMPHMSADDAPKAFQCEKEVSGSRWVAIYRGTVRPPHSGKFRFVGAGDDVVVVRFNNRNVFDYGYESATANVRLAWHIDQLTGKVEDREFEKARRDLAMPKPVTIYSYDAMPGGGKNALGGLGVGIEFEARDSTDYPIEILVSEVPGGSFFAYLMIEEIGVKYAKDATGSPILPVFRIDAGAPAAGAGPPYDVTSPASAPWKLVQGTRPGI